MEETGAVPPSSSLSTSEFKLDDDGMLDDSAISFCVCKREPEPVVFLALSTSSILCVLDISTKKIHSLGHLFKKVKLLSVTHMSGNFAAVTSHDGKVFAVDFIKRNILCQSKPFKYPILALHAKGKSILVAARDHRRLFRVVVLELCEYSGVFVLEQRATFKMAHVPNFVKLVAIDKKPSVLAFFETAMSHVVDIFEATRSSAPALLKASTYAHFYDIAYESLVATRSLFHDTRGKNGYHPAGVALNHKGERYAVVSRKEGASILSVSDINHMRSCDAVIEASSKWAKGVNVSWSSVEERVYLTGQDGYTRTIGVANAAEMAKPPVVTKFKQHKGGVKFVEAFDDDGREKVVTVGKDKAVRVWSRPTPRPIEPQL